MSQGLGSSQMSNDIEEELRGVPVLLENTYAGNAVSKVEVSGASSISRTREYKFQSSSSSQFLWPT